VLSEMYDCQVYYLGSPTPAATWRRWQHPIHPRWARGRWHYMACSCSVFTAGLSWDFDEW